MRIYHTINSGLIISYLDTILWIDVLHGKSDGFSSVPKAFLEAMRDNVYPAFSPDGLVFTHAHPDHYDEALAAQVCGRYPAMPMIMPGKSIHCAGHPGKIVPGISFSIGDMEILQFPTKHDGPMYADVHHTSLIITCGTESVWISGDGEFQQEDEYRAILQEYMPAYGFFNIYQLGRPAVHKNIIEASGMKHVYLYHLGYPDDDEFQYIRLAELTLKHHPEFNPFPQLLRPMTQVL